MLLMQQSEATALYRKIRFFCADDDSADAYAPKTGLTFSAGELKVAKGGSTTEANAAGTVTEQGGGWYDYEFTASELDTVGLVSLRVIKTDVYSEMVMAQVVPWDPYAGSNLGLTSFDATISSRLATTSYESPTVALTSANGVETGLSMQGALRLILAMAGGRRSGIGTGTEQFRDYTNSKGRVTMTFDANGNTSSVTYDPN